MAWNPLKNIVNRMRRIGENLVPRRAFSFFKANSVTPDTAMQVSAFHRGVIYISSQMAKLPFVVKDKSNEVVYGKITALINLRPNNEMSAFYFKSFLIQSAIVYGNGYAEIQRNAGGQPIALWPIPHDAVSIMRTPDDELVYRVIDGYGPNQDSYIRLKDMIHIKNFHTKNGLIGEGVVSYGANTLGISIGADSFAKGIFDNGGMPSAVVTVPGGLDDKAWERIKQSWEENHGNGNRKSGGTAFFEEGMTYQPISLAPEVMQMLESRKFSVLEVARFLGVPPTKLFDMEGAKFANMENANLEVVTDTLHTWAVALEQEIDIKLLNEQFGGNHSEIDLFSLARGDMAARAEYYNKMMGTASITSNEIRKREGFAPYADGNKFYVATNNFTPVDRMDEVIDSQIKKNEEPKQVSTPAKPNAEVDNAIVKYLTKG